MPKTLPRADDKRARFGELSRMQSAAEIRARLCDLQLERLEAESSGLVRCDAYMADLAAERAEQQHALVGAALQEVLQLRSELSKRQFG
jgi:hypothetical protein